jgi:putative chitinase
MSITLAQLKACMPYAGDRAPIFLEALNKAMEEFGITSPLRQSAFLAQIAHESGSLRYTVELADGRGYDPTTNPSLAAKLGNTEPGDGPRFKGRGLIQLTGRANYERAGKALGKDLLKDTSYLETPVGASRSAAWFWKDAGLNTVADNDEFGAITKKINGGYNGLDDRIRHYVRARKALAA